MSILAELVSSKNKDWNIGERIDADINQFIDNSELRQSFENQYLRYQNIGIDVLAPYGSFEDVDLDIFRDFLTYIHDMVIPLPDYNYNTLTRAQIIFLTRTVYDLLFVDIVGFIQSSGIEDPMDERSLQSQLMDNYTKLYDILDSIKPGLWVTMRTAYAIELFDNDLSDLVSNHISRLNLDL